MRKFFIPIAASLLTLAAVGAFDAYMEVKETAKDVEQIRKDIDLIKSWGHLHNPDVEVLMLDAPEWTGGE